MKMREVLKQAAGFWSNYWGDSLMVWLFFASLVFLLIFRRKKKSTKYLLAYSLIVIGVFFCPVTAKIIQKCIGSLVYWRVLWLLPLTPVIAAAMTEFLKERKGLLQFVLVCAAAGAVAISGKGIYQAGNYELVRNNQKVPVEVAALCEMVKKDAGDTPFLLAADNFISPYVRVYDPSIYMPFNREGRGGKGKKSYRLYQALNAPELDYHHIGAMGREFSCNYLVVRYPNEQQKKELEANQYQEVGTTGFYCLYRLGDRADSVRNSLLDDVIEPKQ